MKNADQNATTDNFPPQSEKSIQILYKSRDGSV